MRAQCDAITLEHFKLIDNDGEPQRYAVERQCGRQARFRKQTPAGARDLCRRHAERFLHDEIKARQ
jgi:hypothetical protein